jgi:hypothetical protein
MTENLSLDQLHIELEDAHQRSTQYYLQGDQRNYLFWLDRWDHIRDMIYKRTR